MKRYNYKYQLLLLFIPCWLFTAFNTYNPDLKATAIAEVVLQNMGGMQAWEDTRFLAWTYNNQYQIWDKKQEMYRLEEGNMVVVLQTKTREGKVYLAGQEVQDQQKAANLLKRAYKAWVNNTCWLIMPFRLQDPSMQLTYVGEDYTIDGAEAEVLEMICCDGMLTSNDKYKLWIDKEKGLVTQWAFFKNQNDSAPIFVRRWTNYKRYGSIKIASDRSNPQSDFELFHIAAPASVPDEIFNSAKPISKFWKLYLRLQ